MNIYLFSSYNLPYAYIKFFIRNLKKAKKKRACYGKAEICTDSKLPNKPFLYCKHSYCFHTRGQLSYKWMSLVDISHFFSSDSHFSRRKKKDSKFV